MPGADDILVAARSALLDALLALGDHADQVTIIGAQAIYLRTGAADVALAEATKDSDLVLDPRNLADDPRLKEAMTGAGFHQNLENTQPGAWLSPTGIPVDLMVPEALAGAKSRRSGRIPPRFWLTGPDRDRSIPAEQAQPRVPLTSEHGRRLRHPRRSYERRRRLTWKGRVG